MVSSAVIGTLCSRTVVRAFTWQLPNVKIIPSKVLLKFRDSWKLYSEMKATIPAQTAQTNCSIEVEIINAGIYSTTA